MWAPAIVGNGIWFVGFRRGAPRRGWGAARVVSGDGFVVTDFLWWTIMLSDEFLAGIMTCQD